MSNFMDGYSEETNPAAANDDWKMPLAKTYPALADALEGDPMWKPGNKKRPPFTLMVFAKDGRLKVSLSSVHAPRTCWIEIKSSGELLDCVETALATGTGSWQTKPVK